jgi:hypothetical protein
LYILTPLVAVFALILYGYLFKIILAWELPNRSVSWVVSILAGGGLLIITLLYPLRLEGKKFVVFLSRYFGLLILPLFVLMTVCIFRRIGDYGITIRRFYLLLLNIWFYGIYAYLFIIKSQRIKWILISPAVIALFFSIGFWSIPNVTKRIITSELNNYLDNKKIDISDTTFFDDMEQKKKDKIGDKLIYLDKTYGKESIQVFFSDNISRYYSIYGICSDLGFGGYTKSSEREWFSYYTKNGGDNTKWEIEQFNVFVPIRYNSYEKYDAGIKCSYKDGQLTIKINSDNRVFNFPIEKIAMEYYKNEKKSKNGQEEGKGKIFKYSDYTILICNFSGNYYKTEDKVKIDEIGGYLFYNK